MFESEIEFKEHTMKKVILAITVLAASSLAVANSSYIKSPSPVVIVAQKSVKAPLGDLSKFRAIALDTLVLVKAKKLTAAATRVTALETLWDTSANKLQAMNPKVWGEMDVLLDSVLGELRIDKPTVAACQKALEAFLKKMDSLK